MMQRGTFSLPPLPIDAHAPEEPQAHEDFSR